MTDEDSSPSPAATWVIRCLGVAPPEPKATMWLDWMLAPAEVPATTAPRRWARTMASPTGVPLMIPESLSWLPPVMKTPVAPSSAATRSSSWASSRDAGSTAATSAAPSLRKSASYTATISSPIEEAVGITTMRASRPPLAATKSCRTVRRRSLSSAPPMIMRGPRGMGVTLGHESARTAADVARRDVWWCWIAAGAGARLWDVSNDAPRRLVLMRHAKAVDVAATDASRPLSDRGRRDAAAAGGWLAAQGVRPDHALVSSAVRTRETWEQVAAAAGWDLEPVLDQGLYEAGTDSVLDLVRLVDPGVATLVVVGHNPTTGSLAELLDDGEGDPDAVTGLLTGYPTAAVTVYAVAPAWADLAERSATVLAHHVPRG